MSNWKLANAAVETSTQTCGMTVPGTADTWTAWTDFSGTTPRNVQGLYVTRAGNQINARFRVELGFDSGNAVLVSGGLPFAGAGTTNLHSQEAALGFLPLAVPAGVTLCARLQSNVTTGTATIRLWYVLGDALWPMAPLSRIDVEGWVSGVNGTNIASNTSVQFLASAPRKVRATNITSLGANSNSGGIQLRVATGTGTTYLAERRIAPLTSATQGPEYSYLDHMQPCNVAAGSAIYGRVSSARSAVIAVGY